MNHLSERQQLLIHEQALRLDAIRTSKLQGQSNSEISRTLGITRERVRQLVRDLGLPSGLQMRTEKEKAIVQSYLEGKEISDIARVFNLRNTSIRNILVRRGVTLRPRHSTVPHGTRTRYMYGCRCPDCTNAHRLVCKERRERGWAPTHGNSGYVNFGCRCPICKAANSIAQKKQRRRKKHGVAPTGRRTHNDNGETS